MNRQQWEYHVEPVETEELNDWLNRQGKLGWELVSAFPVKSGEGASEYMLHAQLADTKIISVMVVLKRSLTE